MSVKTSQFLYYFSDYCIFPPALNFTGYSWLILVLKILQGICLRGV